MLIEVQFPAPEGNLSVLIEDDGLVCYAYLVGTDSLKGSVWLYNRVGTPNEVPNRGKGLPQLNVESAVIENNFEVPETASDFEVCFRIREGVVECGIYCRGKLLAVVGEGDFPGWCMNARIDNTLALRLAE